MFDYPDIEIAVMEVLTDIAEVFLYLPSDLHERAPAIHVFAVPTAAMPDDILRSERIQVDVYARGRDAAKTLSEEILRRLVGGPHETEAGLLDAVTVDIYPTGVPYMSDEINLYTATYRVDTRPL